jgi:hypothetical protein
MNVPSELQLLEGSNPLNRQLVALGVEPNCFSRLNETHDEKTQMIMEGVFAWPTEAFELTISLVGGKELMRC